MLYLNFAFCLKKMASLVWRAVIHSSLLALRRHFTETCKWSAICSGNANKHYSSLQLHLLHSFQRQLFQNIFSLQCLTRVCFQMWWETSVLSDPKLNNSKVKKGSFFHPYFKKLSLKFPKLNKLKAGLGLASCMWVTSWSLGGRAQSIAPMREGFLVLTAFLYGHIAKIMNVFF